MKSKKIFLIFLFFILSNTYLVFSLPKDSENNIFNSHKQNTNLSFTFTSDIATSCNITIANTPNGIVTYNREATKQGHSFVITLDKNNFIKLGEYCFNIECTNGTNIETGSKCFIVTPSGNLGYNNLIFIIFIISIIYSISFIGFFRRNEIITLFGGMFMIGLGVYLINNGIVIYRDWITNYFSYITIGIGAFFSLSASISILGR